MALEQEKALKNAGEQETSKKGDGRTAAVNARAKVIYSDDDKKTYLMLTAPENGGAPLTEEQIRRVLEENEVTQGILENQVKKMAHSPVYDKLVSIALVPVDAQGYLLYSDDGITTSLLVTPPENGGAVLTEDDIYALLEEAEITEGVKEEAISDFVAHPIYEEPVVIALKPIDAKIEFTLAEDKMAASMVLRAPENGGKTVTAEDIRALLEENRITYGIREKVIHTMAARPLYNMHYVVAKGVHQMDGRDGSVKDLYPRERHLQPIIHEDGRADFKELNFIQNIMEGDPICQITQPTAAVDGYNVLGEVLPGRDGEPAVIPMGKNTDLSAERDSLVATKNGNLIFNGDRFHIEDVLYISGSVDNSVGNIDFCGDVTITGDVCEGYTVKSGKNVLVNGSVEGASIEAKGNISLSKGMNGMYKGAIQAGGEIRCRFLENCNASAGGCIYAESILNSNVTSNDRIVLRGRRGLIVGGTCSALNSIEAREIGSSANIATVVILGATAELQTQQKKLKAQLKDMTRKLEGLAKDIAYLESHLEKGELSQDRLGILGVKRKEKTILLIKSSGATKQLEGINQQICDMENSRLYCMEIHPPTKVCIGNASLSVRAQEVNRLFYFKDGEVQMGTISGLPQE